MGICPRCGSWVDDGDVCRSCGGVREVTRDEPIENNPPVDLWALRRSAEEKINSAMFEARGNYNYGEAMRLVNSAIDEIGNHGELSDLKEQAFDLRAEILEHIRDEDANKHYEEILKKKGRNKLVNMRTYNYKFNPNDLVFKLVKDDDGFINAYYDDIKVGYITEAPNQKYYSAVSELKNLPKISYAKYFCRYPGKYNYDGGNHGYVLIELLDSPVKFDIKTKERIKQNPIDDDLLIKREAEARNDLKLITMFNQYSKELITIVGTSFHKAVEFEEGMELKLVKEPDNSHDKDAIAIYFGDDKVGYVANSKKTTFCKTARASELKNLPNVSYAKYLMKHLNRYHIARLKKC